MMARSSLHTVDPLALRCLMTETLFDVGHAYAMPLAMAVEPVSAVVEQPVAPKAEEAAPPAPSFPHFGGNKGQYLFLTNDSQHEWMSAAALDAFIKTLTALKLTADDVSVFNVSGPEVFPSKDDIVSFFNPRVLISLGVSLPWTGLDNLSVASVVDHQGIRVFQTHTFEEFLVDADKKRLFWATIKTLLT